MQSLTHCLYLAKALQKWRTSHDIRLYEKQGYFSTHFQTKVCNDSTVGDIQENSFSHFETGGIQRLTLGSLLRIRDDMSI